MGDDANPFATLESALEYVSLLAEVASETQAEMRQELSTSEPGSDRRQQALYIVDYKLEQLLQQLVTVRRLLNDLRTMRRLLLGERAQRAVADSHQDVESR
jgi:hypothetical protein